MENGLFMWSGAYGAVNIYRVWANQGWREAQVVAELPGRNEGERLYLVEYEMPKGTTALWLARLRDGNVIKVKNMPYPALNKAWWEAIREAGSQLQMKPQQTGPARRAQAWAQMADYMKGVTNALPYH